MSGPPEGTRPKSALPNPPSRLPPMPPPPVVSVPKACASVPTVLHSGMQSTLQQYHSGQPESSAQNGSNSQNLPAPVSGAVSISFSVGQMTTRVDFQSRQDFEAYGYNILQQAHGASMMLAMQSSQMEMNQLHAWQGQGPQPNIQFLSAGSSGWSNQSQQQLMPTPHVLFQPSVQSIPWPYLLDSSLPKQGWVHVGSLFFHLPDEAYLAGEYDERENQSPMHGSFETLWKQNPVFRVHRVFRDLKIYDKDGPLTITDAVHFDFEALVPIFTKLRNVLLLAYGRRRSVSEIKLELPKTERVPAEVWHPAAQYMFNPSFAGNPQGLQVDWKHWVSLAKILASSGQLHNLQQVRLISLDKGCIGLVADVDLSHGVAKPSQFTGEDSGFNVYYVAHNTNPNAAASILSEGIFRPSKFDSKDINWTPSSMFYARGHMSSEMQAMATAARFYSDARPVCVLARAIVRQFSHVRPPTGGIHTDIAAGMLYDCVRAKDGRWAFRCSTTQPTGLAVWVWPSATE